MPCFTDDRDDNTNWMHYWRKKAVELEKSVEKFEAVLCGIMQVDPTIVDRIKWREVGISKEQHMNWWREHQKKDALRRAEEARKKAERAEAKKLLKEANLKAREARKEELRKELAKMEAEDAKKAAKT